VGIAITTDGRVSDLVFDWVDEQQATRSMSPNAVKTSFMDWRPPYLSLKKRTTIETATIPARRGLVHCVAVLGDKLLQLTNAVAVLGQFADIHTYLKAT
jgi:hypothetical protein